MNQHDTRVSDEHWEAVESAERASRLVASSGLVGREQERRLLRELLEQADDGRGGLALVSGEAGIGKTTLVEDLSRQAIERGALVLAGGCYDLTTTPPYGPWVEILRDYPDPDGLPDLPEQLQPGRGMAGIDSQAALFDLVGRFLSSVADMQPLFVLLEDLHWTDPASLDLLRFVSRTLADRRLMVVATYRDDEINRDHPLAPLLPALVREGRVHRIELQRLDTPSVTAIVRARYRLSAENEARLLAYLDGLAEGNPFFIHELLRTLEGQQLLNPVAGGWQLGDLADAGVPSLVQLVIDGRLARLETETRLLLDLAAVIGYATPLDLLAGLYDDISTDGLDRALEEAVEHLILQVIASRRSARFSHALMRQTIYEEIPIFQRQRLHRRIGERMATHLRPDPAAVANHFYEAGDGRALEWLEQAAKQAQSLFAPEAVVAECDRAFDLAGHLGVDAPLGLYRLRGLARESLGDFDGAREDHEIVLERAQRWDDQKSEWQALLDLGTLWTSRDYEQAGFYYQRALELAMQLDDALLLAGSHNRIGNWFANTERMVESEKHHLDALKIFQDLEDKAGLQTTYDLLSTSALLAGNLGKSCQYHDQSIGLVRRLDNPPALALALGAFALSAGGAPMFPCYVDPARKDEVVPAGNEARRVARDLGWKSIEAYTYALTTQPLTLRGNYQAALDVGLKGLKIADDISHAQWICYSRENIADIYRDLLLPEAALRYLEPALPVADATGSTVWRSLISSALALTIMSMPQPELGRARAVLSELPDSRREKVTLATLIELFCWATLLLAEGDADAALELLDQLIARDPAGRGEEVPKTLNLRGEILVALNRLDEAETVLRASLDCATELGFRPYRWRAYALLGKLYVAQGRIDQANEAVDVALEIVDELADELDDCELRAEFQTNALVQIPGAAPYAPDRSSESNPGGLTGREIEVLRLVARGMTDAEVSEELFVSPRTVSQHLRSVYNKLEVNNRTAAALWAAEQGLV